MLCYGAVGVGGDHVELKLHRYFLDWVRGGMISPNHWEVRHGERSCSGGEA